MLNVSKRCTCGDTTIFFHPDENQHEPNCWDCYLQAQEEDWSQKTAYIRISPDKDDLPF